MVTKTGRLVRVQRQEVSQQLTSDLGILSGCLKSLSSIANRVADKLADALEILGVKQVCQF